MAAKGEIKLNRRSYRKPQMEQVQLTLEEAVLTTCKSGGSGGPGAGFPCGGGPKARRCATSAPS